jgi:predicted Zn-dependent protease
LSRYYALFFAAIALIAAQGCGGASGMSGASDGASGGTSSSSQYQQDVSFIYTSVTAINVEVAYEPGAEPYSGSLPSGQPLWTVARDNITALFSRRSVVPTVTVPMNLSQMKALDAQNKATWTISDILALGNAQRVNGSTLETADFIVLFVKGHYGEGGDQPDVLGVQVTGTSIIAVFKDVIKAQSANGVSAAALRYMEQATVVHELGHGVGLVNHGVTMTSPHQDTDHGDHCSNPDCVMNWKNEGQTDFITYIQHAIESGNNVMFGPECLDDTNSFHP